MNLKAHNLSFEYDESFGLMPMSFSIVPQRLTAIMGLNGSGKSTLLGLLSGLLKPKTGEVLLQNLKLTDFEPRKLAQNLSVVPQDFPTLFPYSVQEFVMMGTYPWKTTYFDSADDFKNTKLILTELELDTFASRKINTLSGGERQRVLLARALAQQTPLLLLDEPLNHLDIKHQFIFLQKLKSLCHTQNKTIVAVMHGLNDVKKHFDQVLFIKDGQLVFQGSVSDGFTAPTLESVFDTAFQDLNVV